MSWNQETVQEAVQKVKARAAEDATFRILCLNDIHAAVKEVTGQEIPASVKINVVDGTGYQVTLALPEMIGEADELSETELESIAGGNKSPGPVGDGGMSQIPIDFGNVGGGCFGTDPTGGRGIIGPGRNSLSAQ